MKNLSRRDFLRNAVAGAATVAAGGVLAACGSEPAPGTEKIVEKIVEKEVPVEVEKEVEKVVYQTKALNPQDYDYRDTNTDFKTLFSPWKFGNLNLNHRMVKSAAGSDTGNSVEECLGYYTGFVKGGVELVWVEDFVNVFDHYTSPRKKSKEDAPLKELADAVHAEGGYIGYQLSCMGQKFTGFDPATAPKYGSASAEHLSREEIDWLINDFVVGAKYLKDQGFDAVEINAAGNNIGQAFFSRQRNHRDDEYGPQSFENRARFVSDIIMGIKKECGDDFPVQVLINGIEENDITFGDSSLVTTVEENVEICKMLEKAGANSLHIRLGVFAMHVCQFASDLYFTGRGIEGTTAFGQQFDFSKHFEGKLVANHGGAGLMLEVAHQIKEAVNIPVGSVTYNDPAHAPKFFEDALAEGKVDFYLMNRPLTVDMDYVNKLKAGKLDEIAPCTRCLHCHFDYDENGAIIERCRVNAATQRAYEAEMPEGYTPKPADGDKKVMVVGGGPAGMEAARIAAERGYTVSLYEKKASLGGLLPIASAFKGPHENLDDLRAYLIRQQELKGVNVVTGKEVDADFIKAEAPDVVIIATGGKRPEIMLKGTDKTKVIGLEDVAPNNVGENVTIIGGNVQAFDLAQYLISEGKNVTISTNEDISKLDKGQSAWVKTFSIPMIYAHGTRVWPNSQITNVGDGEVTIFGETGVDIKIPCDTIIDASDMLPNDELAAALDGIEVKVVGDAMKPWNIAEAIAAGNLTARNI